MRSSIIEAAKELFAKFGYKKTTMEDIAIALRKGKSSLYYYFKNKEEIFQAVIESEEKHLFSKLNEIVNTKMEPREKFTQYVITRMETILELDNYIKALKDEMLTNYEFLSRLKTSTEKQEAALLTKILEEGTSSNTFQVKNIPMAAVAIATALKGMEGPLLSSYYSFEDFKVQIENTLNILFFGLIRR
ncbi:TetR/AcrR family transcriptional regulator [Carboxylicivirga linearis]|uniref:TetR/AcrR family transcriptional regulator n=2 Tax=Carboxylicivirga linearis TaxID=1628157 RepID=A0ABS5K2A5_9BACT|nr:TetR/AcrR family transcriptional regulator [Carboxylicivirga linearis]